ncbi:hypothetical protein BDV26DRAFT_197810 [Aspergillus bertholletiae]|uniref:LITAF domain-containing protein n=1 Tax=Aspergillus bertholletiae TaxID=1226010 RepID=A0A5N7B8W1_9EURO|nr:hypothetical protein BDV26DRAFT_197810 [Aspergillus bertholletiae]
MGSNKYCPSPATHDISPIDAQTNADGTTREPLDFLSHSTMSEKPLPPAGDSGSPETIPTSQSSAVPAPSGEAPKLIPLTILSNRPTVVDCPYCHARTATRTQLIVGPRASCWSCVCCIFLGPIGALIPCIMPSCKDCEHSCGSCGRPLAVVERTGNVRIIYYDSRAI